MPMEKINARIAGVGVCIPDAVLTNHELAGKIDTSDEWIRTMTGIRERHIADPSQATSDLGVLAAERAMAQAGIDRAEVDLIILATMSPDVPVPATACIVQEQLGMKNTPAFDVAAGCSGFIYALVIGSQFIATGLYRTVLVIGAEVLSKITNWGDRGSCIVTGDGAGAVVLRSAEPGEGILSMCLGADGSGLRHLYTPAGGTRMPVTAENIAANMHKVKMDGQEVFRFAMRMLPEVLEQALELAKIAREDVALIIPHQANLRIIDAAARRMDLPMEKFMVNIDRYGNTSAASIPIGLHEALANGRIKKGDVVVLAGFGAGLTWGAVVMRWH
ncbi:MAG: 3-oxoacyl-(acyl-carrier-protein) synthase 3 [Syntrophorhabdaceae bacterium PtaU1.Bin034]|nr:MAG: 3-oxoacyl-(acyl-carrier-protein) synthase 3 [Syntrophorhabdaceae bacterium PtaU1.Bin034]